ncbi:MAG: aldolase [Phycisphaerae bacterium]|nr:aldolase [Phycisphaerae bacterium]
MGIGKDVRLNRLFAHESRRLCSVAVDHFLGYHEEMPAGLRNLPAAIEAIVAGGPSAITMQKGVALSCWSRFAGRVPLIIQSVAARPDDTADECLSWPEDAVRLGADAYATCAFIRGATEAAHLRRVAKAVRRAERWDIPVVLHVYPRRFLPDGKVQIVFEPDEIAWAVRCGIELGVDLIKVPYTGDVTSYAQIIRECPLPIVAAGGPRADRLEQALVMAADVVAAGARGMTIGRNVWGFGRTTQAVLAFKAVIHDRVPPTEALEGAAAQE